MENLRIVSLVVPIPTFLFMGCVVDWKCNDVNHLINTFYSSFTTGYIGSLMLEILLTTVLRLGVFAIWEPEIFKLTPTVPIIILPWVLRENDYRPKRISLFAADFVTSCVAAPIVEEYMKMRVVQWSVRLPRNFQRVKNQKGKKNSKKKKKKYKHEAIIRPPGESEVTNINTYVTHMMAASVGLKICESVRRILVYTKKGHTNKGLHAICRGIFPIHELCGTLTALQLARRDVLGVELPGWQILAPAVFIHGMANFRGKKPIFKWNSSMPWSEMQLFKKEIWDDLVKSPSFTEMLKKSFGKLMWLSILLRVLGYCIKNYYLIGRQAVRRTTTYAGKQAAFSAELVAGDILKKTKDKK